MHGVALAVLLLATSCLPVQSVGQVPEAWLTALRGIEGATVASRGDSAVLTLADAALVAEPNVTGYNGAMRQAMEQLSALLVGPLSEARVTVVGHTDNVGPASENERISLLRAQAIRGLLVRQGCDSTRVDALGKGFAEPIADNHLIEGRQRNRRIEIIVVEQSLVISR